MTFQVLEGYIEKFKQNHVFITLLNVLFSNVAYTGKVMALTCSVLGTYYVLSVRDSTLIFTAFMGFLSVNALAFYTISCQMTYGVPADMRTMKERCNLMLNRKKNNFITPKDKHLCKYRIKGMPHNIGVKDGGFRTLHSVSTLEFLEFYVKQVISLALL